MAHTQSTGHAALMDSVYRGQRHIYDLTRKYYLFGRDTLIEGLDARAGMSVLEVACGTGRNLSKTRAKWPDVRLYGLDISEQMLKNARRTLGPEAQLAQGDACAFSPADLFGKDFGTPGGTGFERIVLSYALSMIPDWERAFDHAASHLAPGGELHVVDFGDLSGLPGPFERGLHAWLARFHVEVRGALPDTARRIARERGLVHRQTRGRLGYFQLHVLAA